MVKNIKYAKDKFLITGFPRSGTQYISRCLRRFGYGVGEEFIFTWSHGTVSWTHAPYSSDFRIVAHQIRNPIHVVSSAQTIPYKVWKKYAFKHIGDPSTDNPLKIAMYAYPRWFELAEKHSVITYRVEDIEFAYKDVMKILGLRPPKKWTKLIPTNQNTRKGQYEILTWEDLEAIDPENYNKILEIAKEYNYA